MPRHGGDVGVGDGAWIVDGDSRDHDRQHPSTAKEHARITWHKFRAEGSGPNFRQNWASRERAARRGRWPVVPSVVRLRGLSTERMFLPLKYMHIIVRSYQVWRPDPQCSKILCSIREQRTGDVPEENRKWLKDQHGDTIITYFPNPLVDKGGSGHWPAAAGTTASPHPQRTRQQRVRYCSPGRSPHHRRCRCRR